MSRVEVLVATMHQTDLSLFEKMNIQTDVIFCNQCDRNEFIEMEINGCRVRMLSTTTRGVGVNRNLAMQLSDAEFCLCADDDMYYIRGYEDLICDTFDKFPNASIVGFSREDEGGIITSGKEGFTRRGFGGCRISYRNKDIKKVNLNFNRMFGGGAEYQSGEDSLFIKDALKKRLRIYNNIIPICKTVEYRDSTWFKGYTEKYFFDKGAWCKAAYPRMWRIFKYYLIIKLRKKSTINLLNINKLMNRGAKVYKKF